MKPISTQTHGMIDYLTAGTLIALPRMMNWNDTTTKLLTGAGLGVVAYSLMTRYELGAVKALPMETHLTLDTMNGAMMCAAPLFLNEDATVNAALVGIGLFELAVTMNTQTQSTVEAHQEAMKSAEEQRNSLVEASA